MLGVLYGGLGSARASWYSALGASSLQGKKTVPLGSNVKQKWVSPLHHGYALLKMNEVALTTLTEYFSHKSSVNYHAILNGVHQKMGEVLRAYCRGNPKMTLEQSSQLAAVATPREKERALLAVFAAKKLENFSKVPFASFLKWYKESELLACEVVFRLMLRTDPLVAGTILQCIDSKQVYALAYSLKSDIDKPSAMFKIGQFQRDDFLLGIVKLLQKSPSEEEFKSRWEEFAQEVLKLHLLALEPFLDYIEMLSGLSELIRGKSMDIADEFEDFTDVSQTLKRHLKKEKKASNPTPDASTATAAAPVEYPMANLPLASSSGSMGSAALLEKEKYLTKERRLAEEAERAQSSAKKPKEKTKKQPTVSAAPSEKSEKTPEDAPISSGKTAAEGTAPTQGSFAGKKEVPEPTPSDRRKLIALLKTRGYTFLREGADHTLFANAAGQTAVVPRHTTIKVGTAASIGKKSK
jgi:predicted RNA binding protein YcfA (HicA-like mRNA interferase family)